MFIPRLEKRKEKVRDARLLIIICEGSYREPDYFEKFQDLSSRVQLEIIPSGSSSAPHNLILLAEKHLKEINILRKGEYQIWFVIDTDRWRTGIRNLREIVTKKGKDWNVVQSNPCFEVWLYYHLFRYNSDVSNKTSSEWKQFLNDKIQGGFNSEKHYLHIETAIKNAEENHSETGDLPDDSCTQVFRLGKEIFKYVGKDLQVLIEQMDNIPS